MMIFSLFLVGKQIDVAAFKVTTVIYNECNETYNNISQMRTLNCMRKHFPLFSIIHSQIQFESIEVN